MDSHCISGSIATGNPVGSYMTIADRKVYVSGPDDTQGKGIIFLTDAFGIEAINNRLLADAYAKGANVKVYMPDLFDEKPAPIELLKGLSAVPFDFRTFLSTNSRERRYPQVMAVVNELKESYGIKELVAAGFCFGAGICTQLSRDGLVAAFVVAHPSLLEIPQDIEAIKTPTLFLCAENDHAFSDQQREDAERILQNSKYPTKFIVYPGTTHGFAVRGLEHENEATNMACNEAITFFKSVL